MRHDFREVLTHLSYQMKCQSKVSSTSRIIGKRETLAFDNMCVIQLEIIIMIIINAGNIMPSASDMSSARGTENLTDARDP